jgi:hypothetical protein
MFYTSGMEMLIKLGRYVFAPTVRTELQDVDPLILCGQVRCVLLERRQCLTLRLQEMDRRFTGVIIRETDVILASSQRSVWTLSP